MVLSLSAKNKMEKILLLKARMALKESSDDFIYNWELYLLWG